LKTGMNADASKKNEAESKCPPACAPFTWGCNNPLAHGTCITQAKVSESICFSDCAKIKVQQAAKDHVDSAQEAVKDAAQGATVNSLVNIAKDHLDSSQEAVEDAAKPLRAPMLTPLSIMPRTILTLPRRLSRMPLRAPPLTPLSIMPRTR